MGAGVSTPTPAMAATLAEIVSDIEREDKFNRVKRPKHEVLAEARVLHAAWEAGKVMDQVAGDYVAYM